MPAATTALDELKGQRPEWLPWLAVIEEVLREAAGDAWKAAVPAVTARPDLETPLMAGVTVALDASLARRLLERLIRRASRGAGEMPTLNALPTADLDMPALFRASLGHDSDAVARVAAASGADPEALQAVVALLPVPFLQACNRQWARLATPGWVQGYCPVCGSWPALAEVRGIERSRHYRCGRCGGDWHARALRCAYCGMDDHHELVTLVPESGGAHAVIDACRRCLGYVKTFTRLQGGLPDAVMVDDLASVALDVAAIAEGYRRPVGAGAPSDVSVTARPAARSVFSWKT